MNSHIVEWERSERVSRDLAERGVAWLDRFFVPESGLFHVAYSHGEAHVHSEQPNAASALIGLLVMESERLDLMTAEIPNWSQLKLRTNAVWEAILAAPLESALPLRSFGFLPLFSTTYLAELFTQSGAGISSRSFACALRRVLWKLHRLEPGDSHGYLLYRIARVISSIMHQLLAVDDAQRADLARTIGSQMQDIAPIATAAQSAGHDVEVLVREYGVDVDAFDTEYVRPFLAFHSIDTLPLGRALKAVVDAAYHCAVDELSKHANPLERKSDPSSLAFALATLVEIEPQRAGGLLGPSLRACLAATEAGVFPATRPFNADSRGRALFVPSVEIASVLLTIGLHAADAGDFATAESVVTGTDACQRHLESQYNRVSIHDAGETVDLEGWASDRAPATDRVDSWIGAHAIGVLAKRLTLVKRTKRARVLEGYSWTEHARIKDRWDAVVDPDHATTVPLVKRRIIEVINTPVSERKTAPVFLLYGPPGTAKTTLVQALANHLRWDLVKLSPSDFVADSLDHIEMRTRDIFRELMNLDRCIILLDEMDSLLRDRVSLERRGVGGIIEFVIPALLPKLQDLRDYVREHRVAVVFVTNYYEAIDTAVKRAGRMDHHILLLPFSMAGAVEVANGIVSGHKSRFSAGTGDRTRKILEGWPGGGLVYRDVERLVRTVEEASKGDSDDALREIVRRRMEIVPELYDPATRPGAFGEYCAVLKRVVGDLDDYRPIATGTRSEVREELQRVLGAHGKTMSKPWLDTTDRWVEKLKAGQ